MNQKQKQVLKIIATISQRDISSISPDQDLSVDLGIDSPKGLELLFELEAQCKISIPDDDAARLRTVGDLLNYIKSSTTGSKV